MAYFVTGGTGFIGRFLVDRLLKDVRATSTSSSARARRASSSASAAPSASRPCAGTSASRGLGIDQAWIDEHKGTIDHVFHLAAIYDMTASEETNEKLNNGGTRHAVEVANAVQAGHLHHTSSVAAAGLYRGTFTEDMFDEGQPLDHPYHRTKFESERIAREESEVPWRVYRPAIVLGHSETGEMDKIDGPYYFFKALKLTLELPDLLPIIAPRLGSTNVVPVDFVVNAMAHIAHQPGLDGRAFHLVSPEPQPHGRRAQRVRQGRRRAALHARPARSGADGRAQAARLGPAAARPRHPARRARLRGLHRALRRDEDPRRSRGRASPSRRWRTTRRRCGTTGTSTWRTSDRRRLRRRRVMLTATGGACRRHVGRAGWARWGRRGWPGACSRPRPSSPST